MILLIFILLLLTIFIQLITIEVLKRRYNLCQFMSWKEYKGKAYF